MNLYRITLQWPSSQGLIGRSIALRFVAESEAALSETAISMARHLVADEGVAITPCIKRENPKTSTWLKYIAWEHAKAARWDDTLALLPEYRDAWHRNAAAIEQNFFFEES